jgi:hypothetical protein
MRSLEGSNYVSLCFDLRKILVRFAAFVFGDEENHIMFASILPSLGKIRFCFDITRIETNMVCFRFVPAAWGHELRFLFDLVIKRSNNIRFASIVRSFGLNQFVFVRSCTDFY